MKKGLMNGKKRYFTIGLSVVVSLIFTFMAVNMSQPDQVGADPDINPKVNCTDDQVRATQRWWYAYTTEIDFGASGNVASFFYNGTAAGDVNSKNPLGGSTGTIPSSTLKYQQTGLGMEGVTVVSDTAGNLLFWSGGNQVFNRDQEIMPYGSSDWAIGLGGSSTTTQTVAAFPAVGDPNKFFIVTSSGVFRSDHLIDETIDGKTYIYGPGHLYYSEIDMSLDNGKGGVVAGKKAIPLGPAYYSGEQLTAVPNNTGDGFWVLTVQPNIDGYGNPILSENAKLLAYEFGTNGPVGGAPIMNDLGFKSDATQYGEIRFNREMTKGVLAISGQRSNYLSSNLVFHHRKSTNPTNPYGTTDEGTGTVSDADSNRIVLFDFNAATGQISNEISWLAMRPGVTYSAEFSPDSNYLYVSNIYAGTDATSGSQETVASSGVYRYKLKTNDVFDNATTIKLTEQSLMPPSYAPPFGVSVVGREITSAIRLAPDGKMYVAPGGSADPASNEDSLNYLHVITNPDTPGASLTLYGEQLPKTSSPLTRAQVVSGLPQMVTGCPVAESEMVTVTFDLNYTGAPTQDADSDYPPWNLNRGAQVAEPKTEPTLAHHDFLGWHTSADWSVESVYDFALPVNANIILYAHWDPDDYTVTYDADGGLPEPDDETVSYGGTATEPVDPTKTGHDFVRWHDCTGGGGNSGTPYNFATPVESDVDLCAVWTPSNYTVHYDANGGTGTMANQTATYDVDLTLTPNRFSRANYTFTGWNTAADGSGTDYSDQHPFTPYGFDDDLTVYAQWEEKARYRVTFHNTCGGGKMTIGTPQYVYGGEDAVAPIAETDFTCSGYHFDSWDEKFTEITKDIDVHTVWEINKYTVTFVDCEGNVLDTQVNVEHGSSATAPSYLGYEEYTFSVWDPLPSHDNIYGDITGDLEVVAQCNLKEYLVSFDTKCKGMLDDSQTIEHGSFATEPDAQDIPDCPGNDFEYWYVCDDPAQAAYDFINTPVTNHTRLCAKWKKKNYLVQFVDDNGVLIKDERVDHGGAATAPIPPVKPGYKFVGWDKGFNYITGDLVVTAIYEKIPDVPGAPDSGDLMVKGVISLALFMVCGAVALRCLKRN
ncbi:MAG: InlB B-repeat-containing protein [Candidatus Nomurabacteria bacterium]|jgi:uncharacterized repeat protein (TIGR02543 family)|nr:InlB B-repeat-containing protein [Candidatus Nomurabacteria bacterium]